MLLVERVRIAGMTVFERGGFEETHGRQLVRVQRGEEIVDVIVVVGRIRRVGMRYQAAADGLDRTRTGVGRIPRRRVVLEPGMVRNVIDRGELWRTRRGRVGL